MQCYLVGGFVRDEIMGLKSKDIDYTVVMEPGDFPGPGTVIHMPDAFSQMEAKLKEMGFKIFLSTPEYLTVRAQFPGKERIVSDDKSLNTFHFANPHLTADFVLARKEGGYTDGRRPDKVEIGTLEDDLARRDFTMNAIAKDPQGNYIDPFGGQRDIAMGIISAVGDPYERLTEDALRAVRALRFSVTKDMTIDPGLRFAMEIESVLHSIRTKIADERIKDELSKMFRFDTVKSLLALQQFPALTRAVFAGSVSLDATMKTKGRNKQ